MLNCGFLFCWGWCKTRVAWLLQTDFLRQQLGGRGEREGCKYSQTAFILAGTHPLGLFTRMPPGIRQVCVADECVQNHRKELCPPRLCTCVYVCVYRRGVGGGSSWALCPQRQGGEVGTHPHSNVGGGGFHFTENSQPSNRQFVEYTLKQK